jgi:hypothetical protein
LTIHLCYLKTKCWSSLFGGLCWSDTQWGQHNKLIQQQTIVIVFEMIFILNEINCYLQQQTTVIYIL